MAWVYLIGEDESLNRFKIGVTTAKNIETRLKKLQTGNSNELYIKEKFETDKPFKLEKMLHNYYKDKKLINEWFEFDEKSLNDFTTICYNFQNIINSLSNNPFF